MGSQTQLSMGEDGFMDSSMEESERTMMDEKKDEEEWTGVMESPKTATERTTGPIRALQR